MYIFGHISLSSSWREKCFIRKLWGKSNRTLCSQYFLFLENLAICDIMRKVIVERDRPQMKIWRMSIACWITMAHKHTHTHTHTRNI